MCLRIATHILQVSTQTVSRQDIFNETTDNNELNHFFHNKTIYNSLTGIRNGLQLSREIESTLNDRQLILKVKPEWILQQQSETKH